MQHPPSPGQAHGSPSLGQHQHGQHQYQPWGHHGWGQPPQAPPRRHCSRCTYPMDVHITEQRVHIDHCYRCGASFLDYGKASYVVGEHAGSSQWRPEVFARPPVVSQLHCPAGHGPMYNYLLEANEHFVELDRCPHCYGLWLDAGEAAQLKTITDAMHAENARPGASKGDFGVVGMYAVQLLTGLPVEVHNPVKRKPVLVRGLVALLTVIFIVELIAIGAAGPGILDAVAFVPALFERGFIHTLVSYAFLHGGIAHLLGNLYFLWIFGDNVEDRLGRRRFSVLYLSTGVCAALAYWIGNLHSEVRMVGASGAISGLMGAYLVLFPKVRVWVVWFFFQFKLRATWYLLIWVGLQFVIMLNPKSGVAWEAHVGGFVSGVLLALLFQRQERATPYAMS